LDFYHNPKRKYYTNGQILVILDLEMSWKEMSGTMEEFKKILIASMPSPLVAPVVSNRWHGDWYDRIDLVNLPK
jgi:hypothetical protein